MLYSCPGFSRRRPLNKQVYVCMTLTRMAFFFFNVQKLFYFVREKKMMFVTAFETICLTVGVIAGTWKE